MSTPAPEQHPVRLVVEDDLRRNRLTVFFRLILAIPHFIWVSLWTILVIAVAIVDWAFALATGRPAVPLHRFSVAYVRYLTHLNAYLWLAANPYPGFVGEEGSYPIDLTLPGPEPQERWKTFVRILLAVPAILLSLSLGGGGSARLPVRGGSNLATNFSGGLATVSAFLGWFASIVRGRMPRGLRDAAAYSLGYTAQLVAYVLLVTDRYPDADPTQMLDALERPPLHPVHLVGDAHDLRRSRVLVFFRLPLAIPHLVWLFIWTVAMIVVAITNWFATLARGTSPQLIHDFTSRYVRYALHVYSFLFLAANPFPGFSGEYGRYPLDLELPGPERQNRWVTGFRIVLVIPAAFVSGALGGALYLGAILTWWVALFTGEAPWGIRNLLAYALRYQAQVNAFLYLLTDRYPHASPLEGA